MFGLCEQLVQTSAVTRPPLGSAAEQFQGRAHMVHPLQQDHMQKLNRSCTLRIQREKRGIFRILDDDCKCLSQHDHVHQSVFALNSIKLG